MQQAKDIINGLLKNFGYKIQKIKHSPTPIDFLRSRDIDTVVDIGANRGQYGKELRRLNFTGRIFSLEPIKEIYQSLLTEIGDDNDWQAWNFGVSDHDGTNIINISASSVFSSIHARTEAADTFDKRSAYIGEEAIRLRTLEGLNPDIVGSRLLLKIDTQGHEQAVLRGAGKFLDRVQGIQLELPISQLYTGSWSIGEALEYMHSIGFVPTMFEPVNYHIPRDPIAIVEVDCLFRRINPDID